jgi:SAM-dependent methyltransferase
LPRGLTAKNSGTLPIYCGLASSYSGVLPHLLMIEAQVSRLLNQQRKPTASNGSVAELENQFSHLTAIERIYLSFPAQFLLRNNLLKGKVLDFGCGLGNDVKLLRKKGFDITGYDPYHFPGYPNDKFDTIICSYVLNVLFSEEQTNVLMEVSHLLKPGGKAFYAVRRDLKKEGFREHYVHKKPTYQCIAKLPFKSIHLDE